MRIEDAGRVVAEGDRAIALQHVSDVRAALDLVDALLPKEGRPWVREVRLDSERLLRREVPLDDGPIGSAIGAWQARLAAGLGVSVDGLPQANRPEGLPVGPAVVRWPGDPVDGAPIEVELPWNGLEVPPGEIATTSRSTRALVCDVDDTTSVEEANSWLDDAVEETGLTPWTGRRHLLSPDLICGAVAAPVVRL